VDSGAQPTNIGRAFTQAYQWAGESDSSAASLSSDGGDAFGSLHAGAASFRPRLLPSAKPLPAVHESIGGRRPSLPARRVVISGGLGGAASDTEYDHDRDLYTQTLTVCMQPVAETVHRSAAAVQGSAR
jgi:hypothetical protein